MGLSNDLISQFIKVTNDNTKKKNESIAYGTIKDYNNSKYVKLDGSDLLTPIASTVDAKDGERVTVMIKNHTAIVTGNMSSPAARTDDVKDIKASAEHSLSMANTAITNANNAVIAADNAKIYAENAKNISDDAVKKADEASIAAGNALTKSEEAKTSVSELQNGVNQKQYECKRFGSVCKPVL